MIKDEAVDGALVILTPQSMTNALATAEAIARLARRSAKPILCCFMGIFDVSQGVKHLQERGIPVFRFPSMRRNPSRPSIAIPGGSIVRSWRNSP